MNVYATYFMSRIINSKCLLSLLRKVCHNIMAYNILNTNAYLKNAITFN